MKAKLKVISPQKITKTRATILEIKNLRKVFQVNDTYLNVLEGSKRRIDLHFRA